MPLNPGSSVGPYVIAAQIGVGGMGEVYRATDTNLKRAVAIKVIPASVARDAARLARFQREAEILAALNHPNIAAIYGLEKTADEIALVMELVEGDDLSVLIARASGGLPWAETLPIAIQIADALETAHDQGIVHRDLKPANIKVRRDGTVKVLDFGVAKAVASGATDLEIVPPDSLTLLPESQSPAMTMPGMIVGTAAYMSPEQARGQAVDKRTDLWAFGVVLMEMLTGRSVFEGASTSDTISAVLLSEPNWTRLHDDTPAPIRRLLRRLLDKDRKQRLDSAAAARLEIEEALTPATIPEGVAEAPAPRRPSAAQRPWAWAGGAAAVVLAVVAGVLSGAWREPREPALALTPLSFEQGGQTRAVWSPDGQAIAYGARSRLADPFQIYVRYLNSPVATPITTLTTIAGAIPLEWTSTGQIIFYSSQPGRFWSVPAVGGEVEPWGSLGGTGGSWRPYGEGTVASDGSEIAWLGRAADGLVTVWIFQPTGQAKPYQPAPFASRTIVKQPIVRFSPDGQQLLLFRDAGGGGEAWLMPYPANDAAPPRRILEDLPAFAGTPTFSWMPDNRRIVLSALTARGEREQLYIADTVSGAYRMFSGSTSAQLSPEISRNGTQLAFVEADVNFDIIEMNLATAAVTPMIATERSEQVPAWAAHSPAMVYVTDRTGAPEIWWHKPGQTDRPLVSSRDFPPETTQWFMGPSLSPDATRVIYTRIDRDGAVELWMSATAGGPPVPVTRNATGGHYPGSWSPDGKWYAYLHSEDGRFSVNKVKTTGQAEPEVLRANIRRVGDWVPTWSPSGDWILYPDGGAKLISPDAGSVRELPGMGGVAYAFSRDGEKLYGIRQSSTGRTELFSVAVSSGKETIHGSVGLEHLPATLLRPTSRLTLTPDGASVTYSTQRNLANLWLMDGLGDVTIR